MRKAKTPHKLLKKSLSFVITLAMLISMLSGIPLGLPFSGGTTVMAAEATAGAGGTADSTLAKLGISSEKPALPEGDPVNTNGTGYKDLISRRELSVKYGTIVSNFNRPYYGTTYFDYDKTGKGEIFANGSSGSAGETHTSSPLIKDIFGDAKFGNDSTASAAFDPTGTGLDDYIARIHIIYANPDAVKANSSNLGKVQFAVTVEKDGVILNYILIDGLQKFSSTQSDRPQSYQLRSLLQITAGDYNGDGQEEFAVFLPFERKIKLYSFNTSTNKITDAIGISKKEYTVAELGDNSKYNTGTAYWENVPIAHLTTGDVTNDGMDDLIVTTSLKRDTTISQTAYDLASCTAVLAYNTNGAATIYRQKHSTDYKEYDSTGSTTSAMMGLYGSASCGDVDGDGKNELVIGSYKSLDTSKNTTTPYGSVDIIYNDIMLLNVYRFENNALKNAIGGLPQYVFIHPSLREESKKGGSSTPVTERFHSPVFLECVQVNGKNTKELIFMQGRFYELFSDGSEAFYGGTHSTGHPAAQYGFKMQYSPESILSQGFPYSKLHVGYGGHNIYATYVWFDSIAVGNFMNDPNGSEQVIMAVSRDYYTGNLGTIYASRPDNCYRQLVSAYVKPSSTTFTSSVVTLTQHVPDGTIVDFESENKYTRREALTDLTSMDIDNDSVRMKLKSKSTYFSQPDVIAVLQAAPHFSDLQSMNDGYIDGGSTAFGESSGSGGGTSHGFNVSASVIVGYEYEASFLGMIPAGGFEFEAEVTASMGAAWSNEESKTYTVTYDSESDTDRVVISMTPYLRYVYEMMSPPLKMPASKSASDTYRLTLPADQRSRYDAWVDEYIISGRYKWGDTITSEPQEFVICVPQTPRVTVIPVSQYDEVVDELGLNKISGRAGIATHTVGDPRTYPSSFAGLTNFDGGKSLSGGDPNGFLGVPTSGGSISQGIEVESSSSVEINWGAGISTKAVVNTGGAKVGVGVGAEYTGSATTSKYKGASYEGTVVGLPAGAYNLGYNFMWRFGRWFGKLDNKECLVLGYLVKDVKSPPYLPQNFSVKDTTDTTVDLNWNLPTYTTGLSGIEINIVNGSSYVPIETLSPGITSYSATGLEANTAYQFALRSLSNSGSSAYSVPLEVITQHSQEANVPKATDPDDCYALANDNATFKTIATSATGSNLGVISYQWQKRVFDGQTSFWENIPGATSATYILQKVTANLNNTEYRCRVSQSVNYTGIVVYTNPATLYIGQLQSKTNLTLSNTQGGSNGTITTQKEETVQIDREMTAKIDDREYSVNLADGVNYYFIQTDASGEETILYYIANDNNAIADAVSNAQTSEITVTIGNVTPTEPIIGNVVRVTKTFEEKQIKDIHEVITANPVTFTAEVTPQTAGRSEKPTGNVFFTIYNQAGVQIENKSVALNANGTAQYSWTPNYESKYTISVSYAGDNRFIASQSDSSNYDAYLYRLNGATVKTEGLVLQGPDKIIYGEEIDLSPIARTRVITASNGTISNIEYNDAESLSEGIIYTVKCNGSDTNIAANCMEENTFKNAVPNTYFITASHGTGGVDATSGKTIQVTKKRVVFTAKDVNIIESQLDETIQSISFDGGSIDISSPDSAGGNPLFIGTDSYEYNGEAFFKVTTNAVSTSKAGVYNLSISETETDSSQEWKAAKQGFMSKYEISYVSGNLLIGNINLYTLNYSIPTGGMLRATPDVSNGARLQEDTKVNFTAVPEPTYVIDRWEINGTTYTSGGTSGNIEVIMDANKTVEVFFKKSNASSYTLTVTAKEGGTVTNGGTFVSGTPVTLTATPASGYLFDGWYENGVKIDGAGEEYIVIVTANRVLEARFTQNNEKYGEYFQDDTGAGYTITEDKNGNGYITGGISAGDTVDDLMKKLANNVKVYKDNEPVTSGKLGTDMKIRNESDGSEITVVIKGDVTGEGDADIEDAKIFLEYLVGNKKLDGAYKEAVKDYDDSSALKNIRSFLSDMPNN